MPPHAGRQHDRLNSVHSCAPDTSTQLTQRYAFWLAFIFSLIGCMAK